MPDELTLRKTGVRLLITNEWFSEDYYYFQFAISRFSINRGTKRKYESSTAYLFAVQLLVKSSDVPATWADNMEVPCVVFQKSDAGCTSNLDGAATVFIGHAVQMVGFAADASCAPSHGNRGPSSRQRMAQRVSVSPTRRQLPLMG